VTPETFAKWKKERLDKKAAEEEARKAKEATGKAMFESGDWKGSDDESDEEDDDDDDNEGAWNLQAMRRETERLRALKEEERLAKANGEPVPSTNGENGDTATSDVGEDDASEGEG
jgi:DRG Family Regulatory Proteins, Tma46